MCEYEINAEAEELNEWYRDGLVVLSLLCLLLEATPPSEGGRPRWGGRWIESSALDRLAEGCMPSMNLYESCATGQAKLATGGEMRKNPNAQEESGMQPTRRAVMG